MKDRLSVPFSRIVDKFCFGKLEELSRRTKVHCPTKGGSWIIGKQTISYKKAWILHFQCSPIPSTGNTYKTWMVYLSLVTVLNRVGTLIPNIPDLIMVNTNLISVLNKKQWRAIQITLKLIKYQSMQSQIFSNIYKNQSGIANILPYHST